MKSRSVYISTLTSVAVTLIITMSSFAQNCSYIELRTYTCSSSEKRDALMTVFDNALIPALNRQGISKVGVYTSSAELNKGIEKYNSLLYTVLVHPDIKSFTDCENKLLADKKYQQDATALFNVPMQDPLYNSCQSALLCTFKTCPDVVKVAKSPNRVMQLRIYNSYTIERNAKKISMFENGGEIKLFRDAGMPPVFFGHAIAGDQLPNLTYMLAFETQEDQKKAWASFVSSDGWEKLKAEPQYKDTANKITNIILKPSENSQL
ncbi:MAG: NIPSNAP family protein [Kiritimatiellae bacterium]|jgi:hypothetical protein|nr:NIPSNAP family protein [Kiritimatiellia bacterium]